MSKLNIGSCMLVLCSPVCKGTQRYFTGHKTRTKPSPQILRLKPLKETERDTKEGNLIL